jgi:hypothetical protein
MASSADHALIPEPGRRLRFSLRDLMALVFGISVGLAAARPSWVEWYEGLLVAAVCWLMLGLGSQMLDLRAALRRTASLSAELRWGGRFAIAWRAAAIAILAGYCAIEALQREGILVLERQESIAVFDVGEQLRTILFYIAIIVALSSVPRLAMRRPEKTLSYRVLQIAARIAAIVVCLLVWSSSWVFITYLVHIAISGIEAAFPLRFADPDVDLDLVARTKRFVLHTGLAAALVPLNAWLTGQLARCWAPRLRRLWVIAICLLISLGATMGYLVWFHLAGLHRFSPSFADNPSTAPLHLWLTRRPRAAACVGGCELSTGLLSRRGRTEPHARLAARAAAILPRTPIDDARPQRGARRNPRCNAANRSRPGLAPRLARCARPIIQLAGEFHHFGRVLVGFARTVRRLAKVFGTNRPRSNRHLAEKAGRRLAGRVLDVRLVRSLDRLV